MTAGPDDRPSPLVERSEPVVGWRAAVRETFLGSERAVVRRLVRPIADFLHIEASGGILLVAATLIALAWANSPWDGAYARLWGTEFTVSLGAWEITDDLRHWVNDALMALFFFVVGLEIKRELVVGQLSTARAAALPAIAALGGMVVPALLYIALNAGGEGSAGWGIPMATDIAFAIGVVALLGRAVPSTLKVFLLTLAIVDDIGAILVIALFYTEDVKLPALGVAVLLLAVIIGMRRLRIWYIPLYVVVGGGVWLAVFESGVHATIAGVVLGLLAPARPLQRPEVAQQIVERTDDDPGVGTVRSTAFLLRESISVAERLEHMLHPWTSYVVIPLFALANAGIRLGGDALSDAATSRVTLGIVLGLVVGKTVGITLFTWLAQRLRLGDLPHRATMGQVSGIAAVAGIGFTVSLFITGLAFTDSALQEEAKIGILAASVIAAVSGAVLLRSLARRAPAGPG